MSSTGAHPLTGPVISPGPPVTVNGAAPADRDGSDETTPGGTTLEDPELPGTASPDAEAKGEGGGDNAGVCDPVGRGDVVTGAEAGTGVGAGVRLDGDAEGGRVLAAGGAAERVGSVGGVACVVVGGGSPAAVVAILAYEPNWQTSATF